MPNHRTTRLIPPPVPLFIPNLLRIPHISRSQPPACPVISRPSSVLLSASPVLRPSAIPSPSLSLSLSPAAPAPSRPGRKHTAESRAKIALANRGNIPWNKGRSHSAETRRKIAQSTRKAMSHPEMRRLLQQRATGRRHTEHTKLKIRESTRLIRTTPTSHARRMRRRRPLLFRFDPAQIQLLHSRVQNQIHAQFSAAPNGLARIPVRPRRPLSPLTKAKLSTRIKQMWEDPQYRARVTVAIRHRARATLEQRSTASFSTTTTNPHYPVPTPATARDTTSNPAAKTTAPPTKRHRPSTPPPESLPIDSPVAASPPDDLNLNGITLEDLGIAPSQSYQHEGIVTTPDQPDFVTNSPFNTPSSPSPSNPYSLSYDQLLHVSDQSPFPSLASPSQLLSSCEWNAPEPAESDWLDDFSDQLRSISSDNHNASLQ